MVKHKLAWPMLVIGLSAVFVFGQIAPKPSSGHRIVRSLDTGWRFSAEDKAGNDGMNVDDSCVAVG